MRNINRNLTEDKTKNHNPFIKNNVMENYQSRNKILRIQAEIDKAYDDNLIELFVNWTETIDVPIKPTDKAGALSFLNYLLTHK